VKIKKEKMVFVSNNMSEKEINKDYIVYPVNDLKWRQKMYNLNENYNIFRDIIDNVDNIWEENDEVDIVPVEKYQDITQSKNLNFLQFIKKEDDETIYTNMLWYWFSRKSMLDKFIKNYLNENDNYILDREKVTGNQGRMDIFAEGENNIIIIENKIKSGLNGINKENNTSQLNKYFEDAFKKASEKSKKDNKKIKKITGFIFVPNYNEERIKSEISEYKKVNFKIITYKELYNFFKENEKEINGDVYYKYYSDFLNALNNQTYSTINEMEKIETEKKFIFAIKNA
jgi:hypothetical protein